MPHGGDGILQWSGIWRGYHEPRWRILQLFAVKFNLSRHWAVRCVVVPAFVVAECDGAGTIAGSRLAPAAEHDQPAVFIRSKLAQVDGCSHELAGVESIGTAAMDIAPGDRARTRVNDKIGPV